MTTTSISIMLQVKAVLQAVNVTQNLMTLVSCKLMAMVDQAAQSLHDFCYFQHCVPD